MWNYADMLSVLQQQPGDSEAMNTVLQDLGLVHLAPRFQAEDITPGLLPYLDDAALQELGVTSLGARLKLRVAGSAHSQVQ